jgi:uncharacterized protein (DUF1697 family)
MKHKQVYIALLRAVNVGGTGKLPMSELKAMCEALGFEAVQTYIASGNVLFRTALSADKVHIALEQKLIAYAGKPVGVHVRTAQEMTSVLSKNPFSGEAPSRVMAIFLDEAPDEKAITNVTGRANEELRLGTRELYVHYGAGMGTSKLRIPAAKEGTARNMNTVAKLVELAGALKAE